MVHNDNLIRKIELVDNSGLINIFNLSNIKINTNIPGHMFSFEPPKGSEIVDLR
jgi:outer membrane lipoprotein-sorting protein